MQTQARIPSFRWNTLLLVCLSLSIGWGIRGNFGHEFGAMMPGALAGLAVSLFSGREDWRRRMPYFALFGAMGWGFGGSIAYMPAIGYTQAGLTSTVSYGYFINFMTGYLWTTLGCAGTAYAACEEREKLTALFKPLCWVLAFWAVQYFYEDQIVEYFANLIQRDDGPTRAFRHANPLYWLDSEWIEIVFAVTALCLFELWDRRFNKWYLLVAFAGVGAVAGGIVQGTLSASGMLEPLLNLVVSPQGDLAGVNPATGKPFDPNDMVTNWPILFTLIGPYMGCVIGALLGGTLYFGIWGQWRCGASLLMHMALGSFLVFLIFPVLLSNIPFFAHLGGLRMMPPRGDSWANTLGAYLGLLVYMYRNKLMPVVVASVVGGVIGGIGFNTAAFIKTLLFVPGNPMLTTDSGTLAAWAHWRGANWHSIVTEQGVGLFYGLAVAVSLGLLATRTKSFAGEPRTRPWTEAFSIAFILNVLTYVNLVKCLEDWTAKRQGGFHSVPEIMKAPLFDSIQLSAWGWFTLMYLLITVCTVALLSAHLRRPLALVPSSWLGKGQLFYLIFLWVIVIGNLMKALVSFAEQRLATEAVIMVNGLIVTFLILYYGQESEEVPSQEPPTWAPLLKRWILCGIAAIIFCNVAYTGVSHVIYGGKADHPGKSNVRFGPEADWRVKPLLKSEVHR